MVLFFGVRWKSIMRTLILFEYNSYAYVMPQCRSVDIDSKIDFELVKILYAKKS